MFYHTSRSYRKFWERQTAERNNMSLLVDTFFTTNANGHGGDHRTAQIAELIGKANLEITPFSRTLLKSAQSRSIAALKAVLDPATWQFIAKHHLKINPAFRSIAFCGFQRQLYQRVLQQHIGSKVLIWEATKNYVAPFVAAEQHFKVIAFPHNLEALVPGQGAIFENFETEVQALVKADWVFCISREEEWLLRTKGANAYYLPYYPPQSVLERFLKVRAARQNMTNHRFLIHGNAKNPPTRNGMIEQIEWLKKARETFPFEVDIVGYGSEKLKEHCESTDFVVHGSVTPEQLQAFLTSAKAALIHQVPTSGALTRIPELLIAGIPVIANRNASRSTSDYAGVYQYDDWIELAELMSRSLNSPEMLDRPIVHEKRVIDCLQACTSPS
jgi:glycosyltransferase involved in cell wall biosynthesis